MIFPLVLYILSNGFGVMAGDSNANYGLVVRHFRAGENVLLRCESVDEKHNFHYWYHVNSDDIIGPYQGDFNKFKYGYEVLSGNLTIRNINKHDAGLYNCVSRGVRSDSTKIASIEVSVVEDMKDIKGEVNSFKIILAVCSLILFCSFLYAAYSLWRDRYKYPRYLEQFDDDEDAEDNREEIYRAPSTSGIIRQSIVREKPKEKDSDRPLISTDFESILDSRI